MSSFRVRGVVEGLWRAISRTSSGPTICQMFEVSARCVAVMDLSELTQSLKGQERDHTAQCIDVYIYVDYALNGLKHLGLKYCKYCTICEKGLLHSNRAFIPITTHRILPSSWSHKVNATPHIPAAHWCQGFVLRVRCCTCNVLPPYLFVIIFVKYHKSGA